MTDLKQIADRIKADIDVWASSAYDGGHRSHLGASIIGRECSRSIWFTFRWIKRKTHDGRMQRLFQRGHREEAAFIEYLRGIGFTVESTQEKISDCSGHFGGSLDAELKFPASYYDDLLAAGIEPEQTFLGEFKTKGTGAGFTKLQDKGIILTSAEHWSQMCVYGFKKGYDYAVYFSVNKNDDSLHIEFLKLDHGLARDMLRKAGSIIEARRAPDRISKTPTHFTCKWCDYREECHFNAPIDKNCRSCINAKPIENGEWFCEHWDTTIPNRQAIEQGCPQWIPVV